jgi:hypothetical protein
VAGYRTEQLQGRWVHSHEEDTEDEMVFRADGYSFPRARGRASFELHADGTYVESSPGPVDVPQESTGAWSLEGDRLLLGGDREWEITSAAGDRLTVRK